MKKVFAECDLGNRGFITISQIGHAMRQCGCEPTERELAVFEKGDPNNESHKLNFT